MNLCLITDIHEHVLDLERALNELGVAQYRAGGLVVGRTARHAVMQTLGGDPKRASFVLDLKPV